MIQKYIDAKNKGKEYDYKQLKEIVIGYVKNKVSDETMTDFLKSIFDKGMSGEATS